MDRNIVLQLLSFLITFQLLFIGVFLVSHKKGKRNSNILLGIIFLLMGWNIADLTLSISGLQIDLGYFLVVDDGFILLYGPLFYLYIQMVIYKNYRIKKIFWLHLLPYLLFTGLLILADAMDLGATINQDESTALPMSIQIISFIMYTHVFIYLGFGYKSIFEYRKIIKNQFSKIDSINLDWLSFALSTMAILTVISLVHNIFVLNGDSYIYSISIFLLLIFIMYFVNRVIFKALKQPEIFAGIEQEERIKYSGSNLRDERAEDYKNRLIRIIEDEKLYKDPQLSINDLAEKLEVQPKILSQVINQIFGKNFFDFINSYRIKDAQEILKNNPDEKLTVLEVMYNVGFNSKSSFNTAFKKATGQTPTEFRRN